jgi:hypothetical protein
MGLLKKEYLITAAVALVAFAAVAAVQRVYPIPVVGSLLPK